MKIRLCVILFLIVSAALPIGADKVEDTVITLSVEKGDHWNHTLKIMGIIPIKLSPQYAIWIEDMNGNYLRTVFVTQKSLKLKRKRVLPVWNYCKSISDDMLITSATPKGSIYSTFEINRKCRIFVEVNNSFDYNGYYQKKAKGKAIASGVDGQPSLIYTAEIDPAVSGTFQLIPLGHSGSEENLHKIVEEVDTITTALEIVERITFTLP